MCNAFGLFHRGDADVDFCARLSRYDVRTRTAVYDADRHGRTAAWIAHSLQPQNLLGDFLDCVHTFFRFDTCVCGTAYRLNRESAHSFSCCF